MTDDPRFQLVSTFSPAGDQPEAIARLVAGLQHGERDQILLGVTGSGKTFTMAGIVEQVQRPTLVIAPNKILAAQLFSEFKELFPHNAVEYFVSYYDYYQPEAYIPQSDTYIEKDSSINDAIDKMRHSATRSLLTRRDVLIVASVSCIYGLGSPDEYRNMHLRLVCGEEVAPETVQRRLVFMQYERNDFSFHRSTFRVRGDVIDIFPVHEEDRAVRVEWFGDTIESLTVIDPLRGVVIERLSDYTVFPGSHFVTSKERLQIALRTIKEELQQRLEHLHAENRLVEEQRLEQRTMFDLEMMQELGYCNGIENYSRHLTGKPEGMPPPNLLDYFPEDFLIFIDESHIGIPQLNAMYNGDRSRKQTLVNFGFRLPSALDNRPLRFTEFEQRVNQIIYVSATPGPYELERAEGRIVEQVIRPTGLLDPVIEVRPATSQVDDLLHEIRLRSERGEAVLVTTLTKRMAEELTDYYEKLGVRVRYLHSDIKTLDRVELVRDLRNHEYDVLIGINLLREGLDLPEVSLVAVLDADKEGFLRSDRSLIQTCGRAARNVNGMVIMYADQVTGSMRRTIDETQRRRAIQEAFNREHGIEPTTIVSAVKDTIHQYLREAGYHFGEPDGQQAVAEEIVRYGSVADLDREIGRLEQQMQAAARELAFEEAARLRDRIKALRMLEIEIG
ncbi:excinuclease ABC subunit UvrB [Desulfofustis glycolicus]|uniref:UvrABC system protein B n=1 Tax=Desulfofustis glycolicus DSM 9705 TaxID=1121409 RepID=A0A1M5W992_9BACT|nr:excinuclease ABC subunit UvrB [Desulfofustis glycolicus]MCB2217324.1 excinuclease ABC subunit UvrB [Desulfobulbaceae bacterium]SHH83754.1 Excinuclease ABC subunit B [Desulfofustis glycolicus DSM 9705]